MAVLGRLLLGSAERLDLPDLLSIDSFTAADFKYLIQSFIGSDKPFILKGFDIIQPQDSIGTESISIQVADSVAYYPDAGAGSFYYGLPEGSTGTEALVPELRKNATNFVYLTFSTFDSARDSRAFWDPDQNGGDGGEFSQDVNTESVLSVEVNVSVSTFPENVIPIAKVTVGPSVIESIQDCRDLMFRLGTGGVDPDPFNSFDFRDDPSSAYSRTEPASTMTSSLDPNPFQGGDKNLFTLKEWMDVVMTRIKQMSGDTYWYAQEGSAGSGPNISDTWHDALGSSMISKGTFFHDELVGGRIVWDESICYRNLTDPRCLIIRPSTIDITGDNYVAYIKLIRDEDINTTATPVTFLAGSNVIDGVVGAFENLAKGDWIKKKSDDHTGYLRAEEFYALPNLCGGTTSPALAQSVRLSANYAGTSATDIADYTKGEYLQTDVIVEERGSQTAHDVGGDFFWLGYRADVACDINSITPTQLTIDITQADGEKARVTSAGHGLIDQDRITITTGGYAGTYQVEVEDTDNFFINTAITGDELGQTAFYAIIETRNVETDWGYELESENHTAKANQRVFIENTGSLYDGDYLCNPRTDTTLQIAYNALTPDPSTKTDTGQRLRVIKVNVKTEFGIVKVIQGESIDIGDVDTQNILSYIGMDSLSQTAPVYNVPSGYNALDGFQNFNADEDDDLTTRAAKLTAMMADRVQERGFSFRGRINITSVTNGVNQDISANGSLTLHKPSSPEQVIDLTCSLPVNSAAIANIDRDGGTGITLTIESLGNDFLLGENKYIMFYRFSDTTVYTWDDQELKPNGHINFGLAEDSSNRNIVVFNPGQIKLDPPSGLLDLRVDEGPEITRFTAKDGSTVTQSSYITFNAANDTTEYYAWFNVDSGGSDPVLAGKTAIEVLIGSADSAIDVATAFEGAIAGPVAADMSVSRTDDQVTTTNLVVGSTTDALNFSSGFDIDILCNGNDPDIELLIPGSTDKNIIDVDVINGLGTLIIPDGAAAWVRVNRYAAKTFNTILTADAPDTDANGAIYITNLEDIPVDQDVFVLWSRIGDSMTESNKSQRPDGNIYEEYLDVIAGIPSNEYEIQGPVTAGTEIQLPPDSRDAGRIQEYVVGSGQLELFLRGQKLRLGVDFEEVGITGCLSSRINILQDLVVDDSLFWSIRAQGAVYFASDGAAPVSLQDAYDGGRFINIITGQPIVITGASGKLISIQGDMDVTGVIDPKGITFDLQAATPFIAQSGIWFNTSDEMIIEAVAGTSAINTIAGDLTLRSFNGKVINDAILEMTNYIDMNGQLLTDLTGPVTFGANLDLNDNQLLGGTGDITLGDNIDLNGNYVVDGGTLFLHRSGTNNLFAGFSAGNLTPTGSGNTGLGSDALSSLTTGQNNTTVGHEAGTQLDTGSANTAIGQYALKSSTSDLNNTAVGSRALEDVDGGGNNSALGAQSAWNISTGDDNVAVGFLSLWNETTGSRNTSVGARALQSQTLADENTALGYEAGAGVVGGQNSVFIGAGANTSSGSSDNQVAIGSGAIVDAANKARIGNDSLTTVEFAPSSTLQSASGTFSLSSVDNMSLDSIAGNIGLTAFGDINLTADTTTVAMSTAGVIVTSPLISFVGTVQTSTTISAGGAINMNSFKIENLATPTAGTDAATKAYADLHLKLDGSVAMAGNIDMDNTYSVVNLIDPVDPQDAATKAYVDDPDRYLAVYVKKTNNTGATLTQGSIVAMDTTAGQCILADATTRAQGEGTIGVVVADALNGAETTIQVAGESIVDVDVAVSLDIGKRAYLSTTPGNIDKDAPTASGTVVYVLGIASSASRIILQPSLAYVNE